MVRRSPSNRCLAGAPTRGRLGRGADGRVAAQILPRDYFRWQSRRRWYVIILFLCKSRLARGSRGARQRMHVVLSSVVLDPWSRHACFSCARAAGKERSMFRVAWRRPCATQGPGGLTLVELLVVISDIIGLLNRALCCRRFRRHARRRPKPCMNNLKAARPGRAESRVSQEFLCRQGGWGRRLDRRPGGTVWEPARLLGLFDHVLHGRQAWIQQTAGLPMTGGVDT